MNSVELIYKELRELMTSGKESTHYQWTCEFLIDGEVYPITKVNALDRVSDYDNNVMEGVNLVGEMPLGTYNHEIYPNRKKIKATLYKTPINDRDGKPREDIPIYAKTYDCVLLNNSSPTITDGSETATNKELADRDYSTTITFQLIDTIANEYRTQDVSCIMRNVTVLEVMELLIRGHVYGPDEILPPVILPEPYAYREFDTVVGRQIVPPDNVRRYNHIIIPTGTRLVDLPDYLQANYGVYNHGLGNFYFNGIVYVYPITNTNRLQDTNRILTIAKFPEERGTQARRTWILKESMELYVAATAEVSHNDFSDWVELNKGIVHYNLNSEVVIDRAIEVDNGVSTTNIGDNLLFTDLYSRQAGDSHVALSERKVTGNMFFENSKINAGKSGVLSVVWENSDPDYLYPGMPVRYLFPVGDKIGEMKGTLVMADSETRAVREGLLKSNYNTTTTLGIMVESIGNL